MAIRKSTANDYKKRVCAAMNFINENLESNPTLDEIAREASFSTFHFHRIFKAVTGETISEFTRRLRLERAAGRLYSSDTADITSIALDCGFSSSQNFAKAFRKHFGMSPSEYRVSKNGNKDSNEENALSMSMCYTPSVFDKQSNSERIKDMNAKVKKLPDYNVAYVRKLGGYNKEVCSAAINDIVEWAGPKGHMMSGELLCAYWDDPNVTQPEKCRVDACVVVPDGTKIDDDSGVHIQTLKGGDYAVSRFEMIPEDFTTPWEDAFKWLVTNGYECAEQPCFEIYRNDPKTHPEGKCVFDICIPLK